MYAHGFSQNSMFSAYIGFCFPDNFVGVYQGGSGLALTESKHQLPGCQGLVSASQLEACSADKKTKGCRKCRAAHPCTECQYWPIYPCYSSRKPIVDCVVEYDNDGISTGKGISSSR